MCGICGYAIGPAGTGLDPSRLQLMRDSLAHRGPDDAGVFTDSTGALAHRRLSIVDLSTGHQPMHNEDGSVWISFNGEIYNHLDLRRMLIERGHVYTSTSDTESIVHLYEEFGADCVKHLRGMFAFAIWDQRRGELLLARDRLGIKPLYYYISDNGSIYFASEIKALIQSGVVKASLNQEALPDYVANRSCSGSETLFRGVKRLLPGHTLSWRQGLIRIQKYWDLSFDQSDGSSVTSREVEKLIDEFSELFDECVRLHLLSDVPLGMFLSGGIDSSAILSGMHRAMGEERVNSFSVAFAEREANELSYARLVAKAFDTNHHEVTIGAEDFFGALPALVYQEDEPIAHPSSVPLFFLSRLARHHVKVVLTGEGSDELLAGYDRYRKTIYNIALGRAYTNLIPEALRNTIAGSLELGIVPMKARQKLSRTFLNLNPDLESIYFDNFAVFSRPMQRRLFSPRLRSRLAGVNPYEVCLDQMQASNARTLLDRLLAADLKTYLPELLMKQDQMSMAASIESRVPFLDHKLVEFATRLPIGLKLRRLTTKYILRRAMKQRLPAEILNRRKMGFPVPLGGWLRANYGYVLDEYLLSSRATERGIFEPGFVRELVVRHRQGENHTERLWTLINFEVWLRQFIDGEAVDNDFSSVLRNEPQARVAV